MSVSRRDARRLRSAGWDVARVGPWVRVGRGLRWLVTGRTPAPKVTVVRTGRGRR